MRKIISLLILVSGLVLFPAFCIAQDIDNTPDPVVTLRNQIEAAPNAAERNRLRLKLSDLLHGTGHKTEALAEPERDRKIRFIRSDRLLQSRQRVCPPRRLGSRDDRL